MSSGFVSSSQLNEERVKRQEEWDKVRKESDPLDAPEEEICNKSLFEQLKINKDKKELEMHEERALKNLVRGIDEDESQFLSMVNDIQRKDEKAKKKEEEELMKEMNELKGRISIDSVPLSAKVKCEVKESVKSKQAMMIGSLIKRKNINDEETQVKKTKYEMEGKSERVKIEEVKNVVGGLVDYGTDSDEVDE